MKQCPNPNCIFYTRLEELPDAYVKCPACGGMLVDVPVSGSLTSSQLASQQTASNKLQVMRSDEYDQYDDENQQGYAQVGGYAPVNPVPVQQPYGDDYSYEDEGDPYGYVDPPRPRWSNATRAAFGVGTILLVTACLLSGWVLLGRLGPQSRVLTSIEATETSVASQRPPVNTPIPILPTVPVVGIDNPTPILPQPTAVAELPTIAPPPSPIAQQPTLPPQPQGPDPTAPPAQQQPSAGVLDAHMSVRLEAGQPVGEATAYKPDDTFYLAVQATFGPGNVTSVTTRWYGPGGGLLYQVRKAYSQPGTYYVGFSLKKDSPWAVGDYRVDIHTNDSATPAYSVNFSVIP